ncbi:MAG: PilZ domain-containing protein [Candidatus Omnitrophica bacterium]|nr:PilZ domain-containing protein [Candidatus Omnitrophota bacterium]MDD5660513.1 PilZ domain-containing protein [Candidatus Omnitrophota bacterium]
MDRVGKKENRCFPRIDFHSKIHYQIRGKPDFDSALSNDISCGGLRFSNDRFIPTLTALMLEIKVLNRVLRPIGKIVWFSSLGHSNRNQMGVEFVEFDPSEKKYLKDFINMQL